MSILDSFEPIDPTDAETLAKAIGDHASRDWRAAAWLLEHHPAHRDQWADQARVDAAVEALLGRVVAGIAQSGLAPDGQQRVVLSLRAAGVGAALPEASSHE